MLILSVLGFFIVIFLLATITVGIAWMVFVKRTAETDLTENSTLFRTERMSTLTFWQNLLARFDFLKILKLRLAQAELNWSVGRVTIAMLLCGTIAAVAVREFLPGWATWAVGISAAWAPYVYVLRLRDRRFRKFREQFPDILDSLARALRAGNPISAAFDLVAGEADEPVATEMRHASVEANLGMGWRRALETLMDRIPLLEVNLFVAAVTLHSRTGGRLSEVIADLANTMRENLALQGEVRALAAHGKLTGLILSILPLGIAAMMLVVSPDYMAILYNHPWGKTMIAIAACCLVAAHFVIRKLVDIRI